jgi:hypothetical protein
MRASMAYFAGLGTVVVALAAGLGGGLLIANIVSPHSPKEEMTKLERRMSGERIPAAKAPAEPVPYLATQSPSAGPAVALPPMQATPAQPQTEAVNSAPAAAQPAEQAAANEPTVKPQDMPKQSSAPAEQSATHEPLVKPEEALAKAREADMKRATEKRKAERRQWVDRRRLQQREGRELQEDQELQDVERKVRAATESREVSERPARIEMPRVRRSRQDEDEQ